MPKKVYAPDSFSNQWKQRSILDFARKGVPPNWSLNSPTLSETATIMEISPPSKLKRPVGRPRKVIPEAQGVPTEEVGFEDSLAEEDDADDNILPDVVEISSEAEVAGTPSTRPKNYFTWPDGLKLILKSYCHCWDRAGKHISYRPAGDVVLDILKLVPEAPEGTIRNKYTKEVNKKNDGSIGTLTERPDLKVLPLASK